MLFDKKMVSVAAVGLVLLGSGCAQNAQANESVKQEQKEQKSVQITAVSNPQTEDAEARKFCDSLDIPESAYRLCLASQDGSEDEDVRDWAARHGYEIQEHDTPAKTD